MLNDEAFDVFPEFIQNCLKSKDFPTVIGFGDDVMNLKWFLLADEPYVMVYQPLPEGVLCEIEGETVAQLVGFRIAIPKEPENSVIDIGPYLARKAVRAVEETTIS